ncbi:MAG: hypothetical protein OXT67_12415, partial [Zetaproteobacteria bacterium]|nr:hypothetical protein [Zetaproteobacteria bacterium]
MCKKSIRLSLYRSVLLGFLWPVPLLGLPVGFGYNQGANPYGEIGTPHFWVYHHTKAPHEGAMVANAMEAAKPFLDLWLGKKRTHKLPVVLSAKSSNASFANFVTDAIELQTLARGGRDLFWHELVHETMYRHFDSIFGTAGKVLYLPWSPAWFIEGLAEALTMSVGSDVIAATERYHARTGRWPTYDKLFNLYGNPDFFAEGYATSGAYLTWILRRGLNKDPRFLRRLLRRLTAYSSPKYYPWSLNPFSDFMPMREALRKGLGEGGRSLYATYQKEATAFWQGHTRASLMLAQPGRKKLSAWLPQFGKAPDGLQHLVSVAGRSRQQVRGVTFDASTGWWMRGDEVFETVDRRFASAHFIHREGLQVYVDDETDSFTGEKSQHLVLYDPEADSYDRWVDIEGRVQALFETVERVYWVEQKYEATRICYLPKTELEEPGSTLRLDVKCSVELRLPHHLDVLGFRYKYYPGIAVSPRASQDIPLVSELIFMDREETLHGDRFKMMVFEPSSGNLSRLNYTGGGLPTSMAVFDRHSWLLVRSATHQLLKKLDRFGACEREVILDDPVEAVQQVDHQTIALTMKAPRGYAVRRLDPQRLEGRACRTSARPTSPLLWAMGQGQLTGLRAAVKAADLWTLTQDVNQDKLVFAQERLLQIGAGLDTAKGPVGGFPAATATQTKPRAWRARPLFFFPWIGADDALGSQFGLLSVPLMDHMQNETLRASVLVGVKSRYPSTEVTLNSTRYGPTWEVSAFRRQLWTGYCQREGSTQEQGSYMDDLGTRVQATLPFFGENSGL